MICKCCGAPLGGGKEALGGDRGPCGDEPSAPEGGPACARCALDRLADPEHGGELVRPDRRRENGKS